MNGERMPAFELAGVTRVFGREVALRDVTLSVAPGQIVGLIGRNGGGKTTLLRHVVGLQLPTDGRVTTLGVDAAHLYARELGRIGMVHQETRLLDRMRVGTLLSYVASFHPKWDAAREARLVRELELDLRARIATLSPGNAQKVAIVAAVCPRPELLLLDEPVSALDPIARERLLASLVGLLQEDFSTIVISSHVLRDVERVVDWIVCLDDGRVVADVAMDDLRQRYAEWRLTSRNGALPARFTEPFVLRQEGDARVARLSVRLGGDVDLAGFAARHAVEVEARPLDLERAFPLLLEEART